MKKDDLANGDVRRTWFYAKTDIACDDVRLRRLRDTAQDEAVRRTPMIETAVKSLLELDPIDVTPATRQGTFHLVHIACTGQSSLIVRSSRPDVMDPDHTLNIEAVLAPHLTSIRVPHVPVRAVAIGTKRVAPFDLAIYDMAPGESLRDLPETVCECPDLLRSIGQAMRDLHAIEGSGGGPVCLQMGDDEGLRGLHRNWRDYMMLNLEAHVAGCRAIGAITSDQSEAILEIFIDHAAVCADVPTRLLHGDLGNHNIFVQNNAVVALIDWEDALIGDPTFDVAMWLTFHPPRRHAAFLQGYGPAAQDDGFRLRCALSFLRIALSKTVHRHRFAYADLPGRQPAYERIHRGVSAVKRVLAGAKGALFA
ncbi:MAG: aminoglycoside phosphotransferase family protein [Candidatus Latescibacteria bacterium]|nr:aminoglycoside phosphotransferase family protein [Candidatus Latescibacterota bacterium]